MSNIRFWAVIAGAIIDNIGTLAAMLLLMIALSSQGILQEEIVARMKSPSGL